ncbi:MAG: vWA domain-containing protein [Pseudomonadota bacterium]
MGGLDVTLLRPFWLLALLPLAMAGWWLIKRLGTLGAWREAAKPELLQALTELGWVDQRINRLPLLAALLVVAIIILALSGPAAERRDSLSYRNLDGVLLLVDASRSMTEDRRWPQLMTMAQFAIAALGSRPGGLIVYAGDSYAATDLTVDHLQLGQTVSLIGEETVPDPGSRPERALIMASDVLQGAGIVAGDVILLTDGAGLGPASLEQAEALARQGVRLSMVSLNDGAPPQMISHAKIGGGRVFTTDQTDALTAWLRDDARTRLERQDYPLLFWRDYGRFLLILALIPLLMLFRRQAA